MIAQHLASKDDQDIGVAKARLARKTSLSLFWLCGWMRTLEGVESVSESGASRSQFSAETGECICVVAKYIKKELINHLSVFI
jgi:hypothetical protein